MASNYNPTIAWKNANTKPLAPTYSPTLSWAAANNALTPTTAKTYLNTAQGGSSTPFYPTPTGQPIPQAPTTLSAGATPSVLGASTYQMPTTITSNLLSGASPSGASGTSSMGSGVSNTSISLPSSPASSPISFDMGSLLTPAMIAKGATLQNGQIVYNQDQLAKDQQTPDTSFLDKMKKGLGLYKDLMPQPESQADLYAKTYGITPDQARVEMENAKNQVLSYTAQINSINNDANTRLQNLRQIGSQEGVTEAVYGAQEISIERVKALKLLPLASLLATAQGEYKVAQQHLDNYFKAITEDSNNKYKYQMDMFNAVYQYADKQEQKDITAKAQEVTRNQANLTDTKNFIQTLITQAKDSGQTGVMKSLLDISSKLLNVNSASPSFTNDIQSIYNQATSYAGQITPKATDKITWSTPYTLNGQTVQKSSTGEIKVINLSGGITGEQLKQEINKQISTPAFKALSNSDKALYIQSQGGTPSDYSY